MADKKTSKSIYLDVCALSRPFDEQIQPRIRIETEAVQLILSHVRRGDLKLVVSAVHVVEINAIKDTEERSALLALIDRLGRRPRLELAKARQRAEELTDRKIGVADAAHLAVAEQAEADFITVDDRLVKRARRAELKIWVGSPLQYCEREELL
jgi:predicted nucleic acid-binding protein